MICVHIQISATWLVWILKHAWNASSHIIVCRLQSTHWPSCRRRIPYPPYEADNSVLAEALQIWDMNISLVGIWIYEFEKIEWSFPICCQVWHGENGTGLKPKNWPKWWGSLEERLPSDLWKQVDVVLLLSWNGSRIYCPPVVCCSFLSWLRCSREQCWLSHSIPKHTKV